MQVLAAFDHGYRMRAGFGIAPHYERVSLPVAGGVSEQPARLMDALAIVERVSNEELQEGVKQQRQADGGSRDHDTR